MKIKVGDKVRVITGSNKGKEGKVSKVLRSESRVIVEGVGIKTSILLGVTFLTNSGREPL